MKVTVLVPGVNVAPLFDQLPEIFKAAFEALNVPEFNVTFPKIEIVEPVAAAVVPPFWVKSSITSSAAGSVVVPELLIIRLE